MQAVSRTNINKIQVCEGYTAILVSASTPSAS